MSSIFESPDLAPEEVAARLLVTSSALADLTLGDALKIVGYMRPRRIKAGTVIIQEGEVKQTDYMLLVLEGDIAVENELPGLLESMVVNIMGPGHLIGEMGVLDGAPRSATCTANRHCRGGAVSYRPHAPAEGRPATGLPFAAGHFKTHGRPFA